MTPLAPAMADPKPENGGGNGKAEATCAAMMKARFLPAQGLPPKRSVDRLILPPAQKQKPRTLMARGV